MCHLVVYKTAPMSQQYHTVLICFTALLQSSYEVPVQKKKKEREKIQPRYDNTYAAPSLDPSWRCSVLSLPIFHSPFHNFVMHISEAATTIVLSSMGIAVKMLHFLL